MKTKLFPLLIALYAATSFPPLGGQRGAAQPGSLDSSFSSDGIQTTAVGSGGDYGRSVAIQSDGKIVVAGYSHNGTNYDFAVVRYNSNETLLSLGTN